MTAAPAVSTIAVRVPLTELVSIRVHRPPGSTGETARQFFYAMVGRQSMDLADAWHAHQGPKPWCCHLDGGDYVYTIWDGALLAAFTRQVAPGVPQITIRPFAALATGMRRTVWRLETQTPVYIRRQGTCDVLPVPHMLLDGLAGRWRAAGQPLPERIAGVPLDSFTGVHTLELAMHTVSVGQSGKALALRGAVGHLVWDTSRTSPQHQDAIGILLRFGEIVGWGASTTVGMGRFCTADRGAGYVRRAS